MTAAVAGGVIALVLTPFAPPGVPVLARGRRADRPAPQRARRRCGMTAWGGEHARGAGRGAARPQRGAA